MRLRLLLVYWGQSINEPATASLGWLSQQLGDVLRSKGQIIANVSDMRMHPTGRGDLRREIGATEKFIKRD
jgi:hypothetical protein